MFPWRVSRSVKSQAQASARKEITADDFIASINSLRDPDCPLRVCSGLMLDCWAFMDNVTFVDRSPETTEFYFQGMRDSFDTTVIDIVRDWSTFNNWNSTLTSNEFSKVGIAVMYDDNGVCRIYCEVAK